MFLAIDSGMLSSFIVGGILGVAVVVVIFRMIKRRKNNENSCGGNCSACLGCPRINVSEDNDDKKE